MKKVLFVFILLFSGVIYANQAHIEFVKMQMGSSGWYFDVTIRHEDSGWDHYADGWRVVDESGKELGMRVLAHPHEDEQPFTRGLSGVQIPAGTKIIYVEAHDKVHGWNPDRVKIDMNFAKGDRYEIIR